MKWFMRETKTTSDKKSVQRAVWEYHTPKSHSVAQVEDDALGNRWFLLLGPLSEEVDFLCLALIRLKSAILPRVVAVLLSPKTSTLH